MAIFVKPTNSKVAHLDNERSVNLDLVTDWITREITLIKGKNKGVIKGFEVEFTFVNNKKITHLFSDEVELGKYLRLIESK